jgi:hypothetical protein
VKDLRSGSPAVATADEFEGFFPVPEAAIKLGIFDGQKDLLEARPGLEAHGLEVIAGDKAGGADLFGRRLGKEAADEFVILKLAVAGAAIEAMKLEMLLEAGQADEALQGSGTHLKNVLETKMVRDEGADLRGVVIRKAQAAADFLGHARADLDVPIKADAIAGMRGRSEGGRFADIVKKDAPGEGGRNAGGQAFEHHQGVNPNVTFGMKLGRLGHALHAGNLWEDEGEQAGLVEELKAAAGGAFGEELGELVAEALARDLADFRGELADSGKSGGLDGISEAGGEADGADHAQLVFAEAERGLADGADEAGAEIVAATDEVENFAGARIEEQGVDGEVAAADVFFGGAGEDDVVGMPAVGIAHIGAEGGHLDLQGILDDNDDAELRADGKAVRKKLLNALGHGIGGNVVIERLAAELEVSDASADEVGLVAGFVQGRADVFGEGARVHAWIMKQRKPEGKGSMALGAKKESERAQDEAGDVVVLAGGADEGVDVAHQALQRFRG